MERLFLAPVAKVISETITPIRTHAGFRNTEAAVEAHSSAFKKELGVVDLLLAQILFVIIPDYFGTAAKLGASHVFVWLLALPLFYLPLAGVVIYLNRLHPLEGGLYQWAKLGFNDLIGFLVAWNIWLYIIVLMSNTGLLIATYLSYALGPRAAWMAGNKWFITGNLTFAGNARLPMVAGWDKLLPDWFSRLHPKYKTPTNSILVVGAITVIIGLAGLVGVGQQEAFQLIVNASFIFYALAYLAMFAIPILGKKENDHRPSIWLRAGAASGFCVTLTFIALSIFPIVNVESRFAFAAKIVTVIVVANLVGASLFRFEKRKYRERNVEIPSSSV